MPSSYKAPLDELRFVLHGLLDAEATYARLGMPQATRDVIDAVLDARSAYQKQKIA